MPSNNSDTGQRPSNWPNHLQFINSSQYHSSVPPSVRQHVNESSLPPTIIKEPRGDLKVVIRSITSSSHPARGQFGLFAGQKIPPKCHIIRYLGEIHCDDRDSDYDLSLCRLPENVSVGIDAAVMGNQARFINDYRGIASKPNATFHDGRAPSGELCMNVWSCKEIKRGEEIVVSYGKSWWKSRRGIDKDDETVTVAS